MRKRSVLRRPSRSRSAVESLEGRVLLSHELVAGSTPGRELNPHGLLTFNGHVLFAGVNSVGNTVVWSTDGTPGSAADLAGNDSGTDWRYGAVAAGGKLLFHGNVGTGAAAPKNAHPTTSVR